MPPAAVAKTTTESTEFICPECGRAFTRAASLGAHRHQTHKVPGATNRAAANQATKPATAKTPTRTTRRRRARGRTRAATPVTAGSTNGAPNRDALLQTLFPNGIPAKENVIRSVNAWLDEAERLTRLR
jgi:hypothetical protein